jgi:dolichyl-phosphate-mannose--protein O-mannosyl transferase
MSDAPDSPFSGFVPIRPFNWNGLDVFFILILIFFGTFSRFWIIQYPRHVVELEAKQIHVINCYMNGSFYLDYEPPLSSIILSLFARFASYDLAYPMPRPERNYSYHDTQYIAMRTTPAFASSLVIPLTYFIVRAFGGTQLAAFSSGFFCLLDFLLIGLGRHIFTDGYLQLFLSTTVMFTAVLTHFQPNTFVWTFFVVCQSVCLGCAISTKVAAAGLWVFVLIAHRRSLIGIFLNFLIPLSIFLFTFCIHVTLTPLHSHRDSIVSPAYQDALVNSLDGYRLRQATILPRAIELIRLMFLRRTQRQSFAVNWYKWPFMAGGWVVLWSQAGRTVAVFGNWPVWWAIAISMAILVLQICLLRKILTPAHLLTVGYVASLLFFVWGTEERDLCGYQIPLLFGLWAMPLFFDTELGEEVSASVFLLLMLVAAFFFVLLAPLVYGYENVNVGLLPLAQAK